MILALGTFAVGTDGFVIAGVLPGIAHDVHSTLAAAGLLVSAFALVYGVSAPLLTAAVARFDRRAMLVTGLLVLAGSNAAAAVGSGYGWLLAFRVSAALGAAVYSPIALVVGVQLSPPSQRGRAVARVLTGMTVALVVGVPLGSLLGTLGNWRWTFGFVALVAVLACIGVAVRLPSIPATPTSSLGVRMRLLGRPAVVATLGACLLWITGGFITYTFVVVVLSSATGWNGAPVAALLFLYGLAAAVGNAVGGRAADRWGAQRTIVVALISLVASLSAIGCSATIGPPAGRPIVVVAVIAWAAAGWSLIPAQSHRLLSLTPTAGPEVLSLNTSAVYLGIAAGALLGDQILGHLGPGGLGFAAAALQLLALAVAATVRAQTAASGLDCPIRRLSTPAEYAAPPQRSQSAKG